MQIGRFLPGFAAPQREVTLGLADNWRQFALLVTVNLFVGGMIGMERSILPGLAEAKFGITSKTAIVSFIATFGLAKAVTNLLAGNLSQRELQGYVKADGPRDVLSIQQANNFVHRHILAKNRKRANGN